MLRMARMYHGRDMVEKAKGKLQECIDQYPDTQAAREAASLLEQW
ncbi:MAG: tetratricopeptide repeat protein [Planctomycetota bacterium]